ncbi:MAG: ABC transporter ATP-binding protein [Proteobacteria bacterium]|nr:ABC transporter ATP-binding protein [Pseudomonadota bacterium]
MTGAQLGTHPFPQPRAGRGRVVVRGLTKSFGETPVLRGIDLDIRDGEFVTILGPSGCGKSTLMRIIAGLEWQDAGSVEIGGVAVDALRPNERDIAMVFQSYALYPHMTVFDNLAVPLRMRRLNWAGRLPGARHLARRVRAVEAEIATAVRGVAAVLHIEPLLGRKPNQLSGGQKQRVAVGRAMVREPRVFLMDEPLSNLDAELRVHMRAEIAQLHRRLGTTFIYVTHDQAEAMTMSDRIVVMMEGVPLQVAPPKTIYEDPTDLRVARFVGSPSINVLPGIVEAGGSIDVLGARIARATGLEAGTRVDVAVRPHALSIGARPSGAHLEGLLVHVENLGADIFLHVAIEKVATPVVVRRDPDHGTIPARGERVTVALPSERVLVFDGRGQRVTLQNSDVSGRHANA